MHARCPHCDTVFDLTGAELERTAGRVRCGCCGEPFNALLSRVPIAIDPDPEPVGTAEPAAPTPPVGCDADPPPLPEQLLELEYRQATRRRPPRHPFATFLYAAALVLLLAALAGQLLLGLREPLLAAAEWRPWLEQGCRWLGCRLPALRAPDRIEIMSRDVRSHPERANSLLVDLTLVNRAPFSQPFPVLQLTFTSLDQQWFAQRRFQPTEYLGANRNAAERLPPGIPVQVVLELLDPGPEAVNFRFAFL